MAEGGSIEDTLMPDSSDDATKSQSARHAMTVMWDAIENAVDAIVKRNDGHDKEKLAMFAADRVRKVAKIAALHKAAQIIKEEKKKRPEKLRSQSESDESTEKEGNEQRHFRTEPVRRAEYTEKKEPTVLVAQPWKKLRVLGKGAFGVVTLAEDRKGLKFAVKEVQKEKAIQLQSLTDEIYCLMKLSHDNIVKCYGYQNDENKLYMFIELMEGSIKDKMASEKKPIDNPIARKYTKQLLCGLMYLHCSGIVHRDIKCANVLLDKYDRAKLADMGISKVHIDIKAMVELTIEKQAEYRAGSFYWMSPEVIDGMEGKRRSDIWSVGCTVYEMVIQEPPFAEIQKGAVLYMLAEKIKRMEHKTLVLSHEQLDHRLKDFLLKIFVKMEERPFLEELSKHPWLSTRL